MVSAAWYPPLQKAQERGTHSFGTGKKKSMRKAGPPAWVCGAQLSNTRKAGAASSVVAHAKAKAGTVLLAGEVIHRDRVFKQRIVARHDGDAAVGDEIAGAVGFGVVADGGAFGQVHIAVDDTAAQAAVAADGYVGKENGRVDFGIGVDAHIGRDHRVLHHTAGNDAAIRDNGIERGAHAVLFREDEFCRGILALVGADRPGLIVQIEDRRDRNDIHVGFVVGFERAHVAPVERLFFVFVDKVVGVDAIVVDHFGQNIFAEIVAGYGILGILQQRGDENIGVEEVNAH